MITIKDMEIILKFNLPEDREDYETCYKGVKYKMALDDITNGIRNKLKYDKISEEEYKQWQDFQNLVYTAMSENDIND